MAEVARSTLAEVKCAQISSQKKIGEERPAFIAYLKRVETDLKEEVQDTLDNAVYEQGRAYLKSISAVIAVLKVFNRNCK